MRGPLHVMVVMLIACRATGSTTPSAGISSDAAAIEAFQRAWARDVRPKIADPVVRAIDERMQDTETLGSAYHAEANLCRSGIRRVAELMDVASATDQRTLIVHGSSSALLVSGQCWAVTFLGGINLGRETVLAVEGWVDARGRLLIVWRIPEG